MKDKTPYNLNLVKINNHAKLIAEQENKFHKKQKTMSKKYLGSQEAFEESITQALDLHNVTNRTFSVDEVNILLDKQKQACANEFIHAEMTMEQAKRRVLNAPIVSF